MNYIYLEFYIRPHLLANIIQPSAGLGVAEYRDMVEKLGGTIIQCHETIPAPGERINTLYGMLTGKLGYLYAPIQPKRLGAAAQ